MTPLRWALVIFLGLVAIGLVSAWALHWHAASQVARKAGRHSRDFVHRGRS